MEAMDSDIASTGASRYRGQEIEMIIATYKTKTIQASLVEHSVGYTDIVVTGLHAYAALTEYPDTTLRLERQKALRKQIRDGLVKAGADAAVVWNANFSV